MRGEPRHGAASEGEYAAAYLRFYRQTVVGKCRALSEADLRRPRVPSGWTPLELLAHLAYMERRWFCWGFLGERVADPWGDNEGGEPDGRWQVAPDQGLVEVVAFLDSVAVRTEEILAETAPTARAAVGGRFATEEDAPDLRWICLHVRRSTPATPATSTSSRSSRAARRGSDRSMRGLAADQPAKTWGRLVRIPRSREPARSRRPPLPAGPPGAAGIYKTRPGPATEHPVPGND